MAVVTGEATATITRRRVPFAFTCGHCGCDFAILAAEKPKGTSCPSCGEDV